MSENLKDLEDKIARFQKGEKESPLQAPDTSKAMNTGMRAGSEFISHIIAGGVLGYGADYLFHTSPLFLILLMMAGFGTGLWRTYKTMNEK